MSTVKRIAEEVRRELKLQERIDEYHRFMCDMLIMVAKKDPDHCAMEHGDCDDEGGSSLMHTVWQITSELVKDLNGAKRALKDQKKTIGELIDQNYELSQKLAQYSQEGEVK